MFIVPEDVVAMTQSEDSSSTRLVNDLIAKLDTIEKLAAEIRSELAVIQFEAMAQHPRAQALQRNNTSGFRGVSFLKDRGAWQVYCRPGGNRRKMNLGTFDTPAEAARAYDKTAVILFGAHFDGFNFPNEVARNTDR